MSAEGCTGLTARWCPVHGDCACPEGDDMDDQSCPLHSRESTHAEGPSWERFLSELTIPPETLVALERDRVVYGSALMSVAADGSVERVDPTTRTTPATEPCSICEGKGLVQREGGSIRACPVCSVAHRHPDNCACETCNPTTCVECGGSSGNMCEGCNGGLCNACAERVDYKCSGCRGGK